MENLFRETFDKINIDDTKKSAIRKTIEAKNQKNFSWGKGVVCATVCMAVLLCIPATRNSIVLAANYIKQIIHVADGNVVTYEDTDNERKFTIENTIGDKGYTKVEDGRLYFVISNEIIDITDSCSDTDYYRYEITNTDGSKNVILIGGTIEDNGWVELVFDVKGNYVFNQMNVDKNAEWVNQAMHNEGVPCGDPVLDSLLKN